MSLGSTLRKARTDAGLSLDALSEKTSIRTGLLREMEEDNFSNCGGETYARGHLRNLAPKLNIDAKILLEMFENEQSTETRRIQDLLAENNVATFAAEKASISWKTLVTISLSAIALIAVVQIVISNSKSAEVAKPAATSAATSEPTVSPSETSTPTVSPSAEATPSQSTGVRDTYSSGSGVSVTAVAGSGQSWLLVQDGKGTKLYSGQIRAGQKLNFSASDNITMKVGNAGVVSVRVNGKSRGVLGAVGEVVTVTYGAKS